MITKEDIASITKAMAIGGTPLGVAQDILELARAGYNLYKTKNDNNYLEVIICIIGFLPVAGDGLKAGFRLVNRKPEILFEMVSLILVHAKIYGDPESYLNRIINVAYIRTLIQAAKKESLLAADKKIGNEWAKYWVQQSIEVTFNFFEQNLSYLVELMLRKVLSWKRKVAATSAQHRGGNGNNGGNGVRNGNTSSQGQPNGSSGNLPSHSAVKQILQNSHTGAVGEHMADYWVAKQLGIAVTHDNGGRPNGKLMRPMTKLSVGVNDQGIDGLWHSKGKKLDVMLTGRYAVVEAKSSVGFGKGAGPSILNDLVGKRDQEKQNKENALAIKEKRKPVKYKPSRKFLLDQQMSKQWVLNNGQNGRLGGDFAVVKSQGFTRHLLYYAFGAADTSKHLQVLAQSLMSGKTLNDVDHDNAHTPIKYWASAGIDKALSDRLTRANKKNGYPAPYVS